MSFEFTPLPHPFNRWWGPFSPSRGVHSGFRFFAGRLGTYVTTPHGRDFWTVRASPGVAALEELAVRRYGGGRVLLLANGYVIKPLQGDAEVGQRVVIGNFKGPIILERPDGSTFNMQTFNEHSTGDLWDGPTTTGLEAVLNANGSVECFWYHPDELGRVTESEVLFSANSALAKTFQHVRPGDTVGRVRITANGHLITNRQIGWRQWECCYVGRVPVEHWPHLEDWIGEPIH
jgi:hypothetical protein